MKLYLRYFSIILRSQMQYKVSFLLTAIGQSLISFSGLLSIYFMSERFNGIVGYTFSEVLICFATVLASFSISECFVRGFDNFSGIISNGEFDRIMVRPQNEILQVLGSKIELARIGRLVQSLIMLAYAIPTSGISWTLYKGLTVFFMIVGGTFLFSGLFIIYASLCFFSTESLEFMNILTYGSREFGKYPMSIYGKNVLKFLTYVVPLAMVQYYPLLFVIGRVDNKVYMLFPLAGIAFLLPSHLLWKFGMKHYKSTGS